MSLKEKQVAAKQTFVFSGLISERIEKKISKDFKRKDQD